MKLPRGLFSTILACGFVFLLASCSAKKRTIDALPRTYLEEVNLSQKIERLPFQHSWSRAGTNWKNYHSVYVKPIRYDLLAADEWRRSESIIISSHDEYVRNANEIALQFRRKLLDELKSRANGKFRLVDQAGPGVLALEIALTELEFSHPIARATSLAVPIPGTGAAVAAISDPHAAFALRLSDSVTGVLLATAADRKFAPTRIIDLNKLTARGSILEICSLWAKSISQSLTGDSRAEVVEKNWDWRPW